MTFDGFIPPTKTFFQMPNEWIDICAGIDNLAELKVVQYALRHTWGYHEYGIKKTISIDEFMYGRKHTDGTRMDKGTGLKSSRSVKDGLKAAIAHGYLECETDTKDMGRIKKSYAPRMQKQHVPGVDTTQVDTTHLTHNIYPSDSQHLPIRDAKSTHRTEKDTKERYFKKDTLERKGEGEQEDYEEENDTPLSLSCSREIRGIEVSLQEQEEQQQTPSQYKTFRKAVSKKPAATYKKVLVSSPPPAPVPSTPSTPSTPLIQGEPRPLTKNEQKYLNEQERNNIWKAIEEVFQTSFPYGVRTQGYNTRGMDALIADHYSPDDVKKALTGMEPFHRNNLKASFSLEKLHPRMPGLLSPKEEPPKPAAHSSRPLDIAPPTGGGWGRRLDSGAGMMHGIKGVRHD